MSTDLIGVFLEYTTNLDWLLISGVCGGAFVTIIVYKAVISIRSRNSQEETMRARTSYKTAKTEDIQREFGNLTIQTSNLDHDKLFFSGSKKPKPDDTTYDIDRPNAVFARSSQLLEEAIVFDSFGRKSNACDCLKKAILKSDELEEQQRIQNILDKYIASTKENCLEKLIQTYPEDNII